MDSTTYCAEKEGAAFVVQYYKDLESDAQTVWNGYKIEVSTNPIVEQAVDQLEPQEVGEADLSRKVLTPMDRTALAARVAYRAIVGLLVATIAVITVELTLPVLFLACFAAYGVAILKGDENPDEALDPLLFFIGAHFVMHYFEALPAP